MKQGPTVPPAVRQARGPSGLPRARGDAVGSRMGPYINRAPIRDSRAIRRAPSGPVVPNQGSDGNPSEPDMAPTDHSTAPYRCTIDVRTHTGPSGVPTGPPGARRDPMGPRQTAGSTVGPRLIGASPVWAARSSYWRSRGYL